MVDDSPSLPDVEEETPTVDQEAAEPASPHGCLTTFLVVSALTIAGIIGAFWMNTFGPLTVSDPKIYGSSMAVYAAYLIVPFGIAALLLSHERFALWRGIALTLVLAGVNALLMGVPTTYDLSLTFPGIPAVVPSLTSMVLSVGFIALFHKRILGRPAAGPLFLGSALALIMNIGWVLAGTLGTLTEIGTGLIDALSMALIASLIVTTPFLFDQEMPTKKPFWSAALSGVIFFALHTGLLAGRGYWLQGTMLSAGMLAFGFIAGGLLSLDESPGIPKLWGAILVFFLVAYLIPLNWTKGLEGDLLLDEVSTAWGTGMLISLGAGVVFAIALLAARQPLTRLMASPQISGILSGVSFVALAVVYVAFGQPGIQPDTFFVIMADQADTTFAQDIADRDERTQAVYDTLTGHALETQADLRAFLDQQGVTYTPYYLINGIEVEADPFLRSQIANRPDVAYILDSPHTRPLPPFAKPIPLDLSVSHTAGVLTWGVDEMDAELVWEQYDVTGEGIIVGSADSGVDWTHPDLQEQYLGSENNHDYTWFDPWYGTSEPTDTNNHGTHTTGTILGKDGIGVAPDAQWIACRNLGRNLGNPPYYLDCMQFLFAPHPQDGDPFTEGDPSRGAHITNNSWGCPPEEGCDGLTLAIAIEHLRNAGQMFVVSAGNDGPDCSTIWSPASADAAFSIGAIQSNGSITGFSSRGPVLVDGSGRIKPDVVAPGQEVISSIPGDSYASYPGTSMASPHVVGLVALLWSANPDLIGDIDATEQIITSTAHYHRTDDLCGAGTDDENNVYGYGFVDALDAIELAFSEE